MVTKHLARTTVTVAQSGKETTINDSDALLEEGTQALHAVDMSGGNVALTDAEFTQHFHFQVADGMTAARILTIPNEVDGNANTAERYFMVTNNDDVDIVTVTVNGGGSLIVLPTTSVALFSDGTNVFRVDNGINLAMYFQAVPTASQILMQYVATESFTLPVGLVGSQGFLNVAATAETSYVVQKNGSGSLGTVVFAIAGTVATFVFTVATAFVAGDQLTILAPAVPDATSADFSLTLSGKRT